MADNPNIAGGSGLGFLDTVPSKTTSVTTGLGTSGKSVSTQHMCSNSESVSGLSGVGSTSLPDQGSMAPKGGRPSFQKLQPKYISTASLPFGTDYKK